MGRTPLEVLEGCKAIDEDLCWVVRDGGGTLLKKRIHDISILSFWSLILFFLLVISIGTTERKKRKEIFFLKMIFPQESDKSEATFRLVYCKRNCFHSYYLLLPNCFLFVRL